MKRDPTEAERIALQKMRLRDRLRSDVQEGTKTPRQAELFAEQHGLTPFYYVEEQDHWIFEKQDWPYQFAVFWIAWRDPDKAAAEYAGFRFWKASVWSNSASGMSIAKADFRLREALAGGSLTCSAIALWDPYRLGSTSKHIQVPADAWVGIKWKDESARSVLVWNGVDLKLPTVPRGLMLQLWPADEHLAIPSPTARTVVAEEKNRGGRPAAYDWESMWIELICRVHEHGVPSDRAALRKELQQWFADTTGKEPSDGTMNEHLNRFWETVRLRNLSG